MVSAQEITLSLPSIGMVTEQGWNQGVHMSIEASTSVVIWEACSQWPMIYCQRHLQKKSGWNSGRHVRWIFILMEQTLLLLLLRLRAELRQLVAARQHHSSVLDLRHRDQDMCHSFSYHVVHHLLTSAQTHTISLPHLDRAFLDMVILPI